eukprot:CAMPEP_0172534380 /NCGR_PEP_ID=MMETSP1067-20121228/6760_1 /TAXON_ID=265564 ORGANISM="Thalassiosira punctigera, Strain Tpunct2005C2" /NCGR_SAMPLE_ID=MMETSP1067 /ASSEMBLY_ACC=CAM_ASM_000444 /LENGTH=787 /DNA_ID=CAMNT_0013319161 /DNA_START=975 /DNA_END=3338 /DNA_ORIENTATION=+
MTSRTCLGMPSKIAVDPLLVALFDIPAGVQASTKSECVGLNTCRSDSSSTRRNLPDDGVEIDTCPFHGDSISLTDEEYSDAVAVAQDASPSCRNDTPSSFPGFRPCGVPPVKLPASSTPDKYAARWGGKSLPLGVNTKDHAVRLSKSSNKCPEYVDQGERSNPPFYRDKQQDHASVCHYPDEFSTPGERMNSQTYSQKKKKKRRSAAMNSLKKLVGRKSKSSSTALTMSSSINEADSLINSPTADFSHSYCGDGEMYQNTSKNAVCDNLSHQRLKSLKSKIGRIRSIIHSLEGDLITTRNELARAHQHLHYLQHEALEAEVGLSNFVHQHGGVSTSPATSALQLSPLHFFEAKRSDLGTSSRSRSTSSDDLHYLTPTSSVTESGEDSDRVNARSPAFHDSFFSFSENDNRSTLTQEISWLTLDGADAGKSNREQDQTPLTRNRKPKRERIFKLNSLGKVSNALTYGIDANEGTPSTSASSHEEVPMAKTNSEQKSPTVGLCREQSFIRAHDLALTDGRCSLLPLHETGVSDVVNALFQKGFESAMDESDRWSPESGTGKILSKHAKKVANGDILGPIGQWPNAAYGDEVLVWTSKSPHDGHGSEYPVVKARGIIPTSACKLVDLLLDSGKVKQYNSMSLGRTDEHCFAEGVNRQSECSVTGIQGEAKIVRSKNQPPVLRKPVELRLLLHARRLPSESDEEATYLTIGRSVWETEHGTTEAQDTSATRCEMLLSVNLIRDIQMSDCCELTTITHGVSPGIPISIGKRIGLVAAAKYIRDVRAVFEKHE